MARASTLDVDALVAIDVHTHVHRSARGTEHSAGGSGTIEARGERFPPQLGQYADSMLRDEVRFGSDFPVITPERWMTDVAAIGIEDEVRPKIMEEDAAALLGLRTGS